MSIKRRGRTVVPICMRVPLTSALLCTNGRFADFLCGRNPTTEDELLHASRFCAKVRRRAYPTRGTFREMVGTFFHTLDPGVADRIRKAAAPRIYPSRTYIFHEGDPGTGVFVVETGLLRIDRTTPRGRIVLLDLAISGALIGDLSAIDGERRSASLSTVTKSTVRHLSADAFRTMMNDDASIRDAVMARLVRRIRALSNQYLETAAMDAPARVAAGLVRLVHIEQYLGRIAADTGGEVDLRMPISQEELGQWTGLTREGAVKGLGTLRTIGLVETGRMRVRIADFAELERRAKTDE